MLRFYHYCILIVTLALTTMPFLGASSLWDMDEGVNAECSREMMETGTWIVPTYNYELRTAKPVMLYWLQRISYNIFGINEWAARLPSVLMSLGTIIVIYELGRRMFDGSTGLLAGIALATCIEFAKLGRAATPDATFVFFTTLALAIFWIFLEQSSHKWWWLSSFPLALAVLTKGPVGLALPVMIVLLYCTWNREIGRLINWRLAAAVISFLFVALPWYVLITAETRGEYIRAFFLNENVNRFITPQENHRGNLFYYVIAVLIFFAPWCCVIVPTFIHAIQGSRQKLSYTNYASEMNARIYRFLLLWVVVVFSFFSLAATKLPNYIAPLYPPLALLTADFLRRWACGHVTVLRWVPVAVIIGFVFMGVVISLGLLIVGGVFDLNMRGMRIFPELASWAWLGIIPTVGAIAFAIIRMRSPSLSYLPFIYVAVVLDTLIATRPLQIVESAKAPKALVELSKSRQLDEDVRLASYDYTQHSLTFYAERRVERLFSQQAVLDMLTKPRRAYIFMPARHWEQSMKDIQQKYAVVARRYDFYRNEDILVVTNQGAAQ